jgi:hypothetical protein
MNNIGQAVAWVVPNAFWIGMLVYMISHPEVAAKWGAIINSLFSKISKGAERRSVALDIQARLNSFSKHINSEVASVIPYGVQVEWVIGGVSRESFLKENKVVLRLGYHTNEDDNIVRAALEYIARGMLSSSRPHTDEKVMKAVDLISTKKLLEKERKTALPYFYTEIMDPYRQSDSDLDKFVLIANNLDEVGYFSRILLRELQILGVSREFSLPEEKVKEDTRQFMDFLDSKVLKKPAGVDVDPTFVSDSISVSIVYVARGGGYIGHHLKWINKCIKKGIRRIYICAWGSHNISLVGRLRDRLKSSNKLSEIFCDEFAVPKFGTKKRDNICLSYDIKKDQNN